MKDISCQCTLHEWEGISNFGITFIYTAVGSFCLTQFTDDNISSGLGTLLSWFQPAQLLTEKNLQSESSVCCRQFYLTLNLSHKEEFYDPARIFHEMISESILELRSPNAQKYFKGLIGKLSSEIAGQNELL
uniref:MutS_II domain-containing protein n=1 Tax=Strongyloides papillosus TaxID=174720 RepID=A0A0N5BKH0_STREA